MRPLTRSLLVLTALAAFTPTSADAQGGYLSSERFGYAGTVTRYASLADLNSQTGGIVANFPARDLSLYFVDNNPAFTSPYPASAAIFMSAWYLNGGASPSNNNVGFVQMYDSDGGSVTSQSYAWLTPTMNSFQFSATGGNGVYGCNGDPEDCGRLWNGATSASGGVFNSWSIGLTATGLAPATFNPVTGVWESNSEATGVTGFMTGIFENQSTTDPASNGWYAYDLSINMTSTAYAEGYGDITGSSYGSNVVATPEPASMVLLATGLVGIVAVGRRRKIFQVALFSTTG